MVKSGAGVEGVTATAVCALALPRKPLTSTVANRMVSAAGETGESRQLSVRKEFLIARGR